MILEKEVGIKSFRNEWQKASLSILLTYGFLSNGYESFFKKFKMTSQQYNALRILRDQFPKPVSTSFLREKMLDKMSDASRLVSRLNAKDLVDVTQNASDRRLVNILISDHGLKVLSDIDGYLSELDDMVKGLTEEEATVLIKLLSKVRDSIKATQEKNADVEQIES